MEYRVRCTTPRMDTTDVIRRGGIKKFSIVFFLLACTGRGFAQSDSHCNITSVGDGVCDFDNNNEDCNYDGGDCCDCTSNDGGSYDDDVYSFSSSTVCRDPDSECVHPYPDCTNGILSWIGDGYCDYDNNNENCDYDGGDCCECTCTDGDYSCGVVGYFCVNQSVDCVDPRVLEYPYCDMEMTTKVNDSHCDESANNSDCGYDGGDCCPCTCSYIDSDSCLEFACLDPDAPDPLYNCEGPPVEVQPCEEGYQSVWWVESTTNAQSLLKALNCSGGTFIVKWVGSIVVDETIYVFHGTILNITGAGPMATINGEGKTRLFTVVNASLHVDNVIMAGGYATSGGAIGASASFLTFNRVNFTANHVSIFGGALFLSGGSNVTFDGPCEIVDNSASFGGVLFLEDDSKASWTTSSIVSGNNATVEGGAVVITGGSSGVWSGQSYFMNNSAGYRGGALYIVNGGDIYWSGETYFWGNQALKGGGGAIYMTEGGSASWTGRTHFSYNEASSHGGALYVSGSSDISWAGPTTFSNNGASSLSSDDNNDISFSTYSYDFSNSSTDSEFLSYTSTSSVDTDLSEGGALYVGDHSHVFWSADTNFSGNTADIGGAVLITDGSIVELNGSTLFFSNAAAFEGGAVGSKGLEETVTSSTSTTTSPSWIVNDEESELIIGGITTFDSNTCRANGGALVMLGMLSLTVNDSVNVIFSRNSAKASGGAVFISSTEVGPEFVETLFINNSAPVGGAVAASGSGTKITGDTRRRSYNDPTRFRNCKFINNEALATGGAVDSASGRDLFVNTIFKGNTAGDGGALRLTGASKLFGCLFEENKSDVGGGPAVAYFGTSLKNYRSNFIDNLFSCGYGTYLDFIESNDIFATVCKNCGEECINCGNGNRTMIPLECVSLSNDGLDKHAKSYGGPLSELMIDKGYWRATNNSTRVLECYRKEACQGGVTGTETFCAEGYKGPYCAICKEGWASAGVAFKCKKCTPDQRMWGIVIAAISGFLVALCLVLIYSHLMSGEVVGVGRGMVDHVIRYVPLQAVKILIVAWQIESQFYEAANVEYPPMYSKFIERVVAWVDFNWSKIISTSCLVDISLYRRLLILTITPIAIIALLMLTYAIAVRKHRASENALRTVKSKHVSLVLLVIFLVYSNASTVVFQMFDCENLEDGKTYNRADYSIECNTDLHNRLEWYAGLMIAVYPIGIPLYYTFLLLRDRHILVNKKHREIEPSVESTSNIWAPYRPSRFYYEVVECMRRVFLTGVVLFLEGDTAAQIAVTFVIAVSFVFAFEGLDPYESRWDTWTSRMGHVIVCASMFFALLLKVDVSGEDKKSRISFEITLIGAHACMVLAVMLQGIIMVCALRLENKHREDPLPRIRRHFVVNTDNMLVPEDELHPDGGRM